MFKKWGTDTSLVWQVVDHTALINRAKHIQKKKGKKLRAKHINPRFANATAYNLLD